MRVRLHSKFTGKSGSYDFLPMIYRTTQSQNIPKLKLKTEGGDSIEIFFNPETFYPLEKKDSGIILGQISNYSESLVKKFLLEVG